MITAIVQYRLPSSIDLKACAEHFCRIAPGFRTVPGLIRKQFIYAEDGWAGGVYLWKTRADAEAFYSGAWLAGIHNAGIMVNNAGIMKTENLKTLPAGLDDSEAIITTNLLGPIRLTAVLPCAAERLLVAGSAVPEDIQALPQ